MALRLQVKVLLRSAAAKLTSDREREGEQESEAIENDRERQGDNLQSH